MKKTITKKSFDSQNASNKVQTCTKKLIFNFNKTKNKLTFAFLLLTGLTFGQTVVTQTLSNTSVGYAFSIAGNDWSTALGSLTSSTNFTISFDYIAGSGGGTNYVVYINDGAVTYSNNLISGTQTNFVLVVNKTTLNHLDIKFNINNTSITSSGQYINLIVKYTTGGVGINEFKHNALNIETYCNANTLYVKNAENISNVKLEVFNLNGQIVLQENDATKSTYELNLPKGIYTVRLSSNGAYKTNKIIVE